MLDAEIVNLYWDRNELAIEMSDKHYGHFCRKIAMNILSSHEDSEECVNDTWYQTWETVPPQRPNSLAAYFGRITRNLSISRFRANRAKKRYDGITLLLSELEDCVPSHTTVEQDIEEKHLAEIISEWMAVLPADDRVLFMRRYWFGDEVKALAKECGVTQNQMAQRMLRLRKSLKAKLEQEEILL